ncbi:hypothetical protein pb186bvf_015959 [Paramecium bursaria]
MLKFFLNPFKNAQAFLGIQNEWSEFRSIVSQNKGKILILSGIVTYPLYSSWLERIRINQIDLLNKELQVGQPLQSLINNFLKREVQVILKDDIVQQESVDFVQRLAKQSQLQQAVLKLLIDTIQNQLFLDKSKQFGKKLILDLLEDKDIQKETQLMLINILNDQITKFEVKEFIKNVSDEKEVKDAVIQIFKDTGDDQRFRESLSNAFQYAFNDVLMRKETSDQLKLFILFLMQQESKDEINMKSLVDVILSQFVTKKTKNSKKRDYDEQMQNLLGKEKVQEIQHTPTQTSSVL